MDPTLFLILFIICALKCTNTYGLLFPQASESREVVSLDGIWKFTVSPQNNQEIGFEHKWFSAVHNEWIDMPVPASYNDVTTEAEIRDFVGWAWYQREFFVPKRWSVDKRRVFIRFGSVNYGAMVYLNGKLAVTHFGGHLPFQADITDLLMYSSANLIAVAVNNTLTKKTIPQGTVEHVNGSDMYPNGYTIYSNRFDFFNYAGIHRPVYLYTTPEYYIEDITAVTNITGTTGIIKFDVITSAEGSLTCDVLLLDGAKVIAQEKQCQGKIQISEAKLWWPVYMHTNPGFMYTLQVVVKSKDDADVYRLPVGIRTVNLRNNTLLINGKPCYLRGFGKHEDSDLRGKGLDNTLLVRDYNLINWVGANSYRTSHYPYAEEALEMADRRGILIVLESPAVDLDTFSDELLETHKSVMKEIIERDKNRPSVVMWSLSNEASTGHEDAGPYYRELVQFVKKLDRTRLVTFVTNVKYSIDHAAPFVDVIGVNRYFAWYSDTGLLDLIPHQIETEFHNWFSKFNKSLFMSEYGADAISGFHQLPASAWTEDYQAVLLGKHFKAFDKLRSTTFFIGEMIWNFADFATRQAPTRALGNHKGIFTRQRQPKESAFMLRARYKKLASQDEMSCAEKKKK